MAFTRVVLAVCCVIASLGAQQPGLPAPPGQLVDVGGRRMHLLCTGTGGPTVVLEAGASAFAIDWTLVQREADRTTRVCSYDRAGMGWSDSSTTTTRASEAADLHTLLRAAGEHPPFVMVGASRGGLLIRAFALDHPDDVVGFVFVDPATEDRLFTMVNGQAVLVAEVTPDQIRAMLPRQSVPIPRRAPQTGPPFDRLPPDRYAQRITLDARLIASVPAMITPDAIGVAQESERALLARLLASRSATPHPFGDRPTVVLSRGDEPNAEREAVHAALARLSTSSRHSVVKGAGHEIHLFEPGAVTQSIADVLAAVRGRTPLPPR